VGKSREAQPPPNAQKRRILSAYAAKYGPQTLVETGTLFGDMIFSMKDSSQTIYSIELSDDLANKAKRRLLAYQHIQILNGDSGAILPKVLKNISTPCLFWLDAHYSGGITEKGKIDTPVIEEMTAILEHKIKAHIILIDDARLFDGTRGYPTVDELRNLVIMKGPTEYDCCVADDVIRIHPRCVANDPL
jgi:hypothetical protein